ncbi:MAG: nucleoside triphosphate pyrophosphohydrolase [Nitrospinae bacterium]|nr:nucleoside triphosphate pyrophosphohydrolase [Nitrospinota bacterium]
MENPPSPPPTDKPTVGERFVRLVEIMERLRGPEGCPWDREQTHDSLKPYIIEEAYEALEAMDEAPDVLKDELGDLLFQIIFHAELSREAGTFDISDVLDNITDKMIRRHPHVFASAEAASPEEVLLHWEEIKLAERGARPRESVLDGVPKALPALLRARRLQEKASRVGFDWGELDPALEKVEEEWGELKEKIAAGDGVGTQEELGDLLFSLVNAARFLDVNPEEALRQTVVKFISRFRHIEKRAAERGRPLKEMSLAEMDALWEEAKKEEGE